MKIAVIINAKRADSTSFDPRVLDNLAKENQLSYELFTPEPQELDSLLKTLSNKSYNVFLIGGGDGTVRSAAQILTNQETPLAILPLGTFNHFAMEMNYPKDLAEILKIIKNNKTKRVDVGEVNQLIFINHSSIGFYSRIAKLKEKHKHILGVSKFLKTLFTLFNFFHVIPLYQLEIETDEKKLIMETPLVFIGNNQYSTDILDFGSRDTLTSGFLSVYILKAKSRWGMLKCMLSLLFKSAEESKCIVQLNAKNLSITTQSKYINVVLDGELQKLESPLEYRIHNKKLTMIVP